MFGGHGIGTFIAPDFGTLDGGPLAERRLPFGTRWNRLPFVGWLAGFVSPRPRMTIADPTCLYRWCNYDAVAETVIDDRLLGVTRPACDVRDVTRAIGSGRLNYVEPHASMRHYTDFAFLLLGSRVGDLAGIVHEDWRSGLPGIQVATTEWSAKFAIFPDTIPTDIIVPDGYSHSDVTTAAARQGDGRPEIVV
ncbi:MAG: hypothetical protein ACRD0G_12220 [Acidimicrobiales bacterium]